MSVLFVRNWIVHLTPSPCSLAVPLLPLSSQASTLRAVSGFLLIKVGDTQWWPDEIHLG